MSDEESPKIPEPDTDSNSVIDILPPILEPKAKTRHHVRSEILADQIRDLGMMGLSMSQAALGARISTEMLKKYYQEDYNRGASSLSKKLATKAIEKALNGNTPILLHLIKTKLGWSEQQVIEHIGEVRAVVSNKPLSKEEFITKYLTEDKGDVD
jgi:hypothetical protein